MSSENTVHTAPVVFGTAGTASVVAAPGTNTSNPFPLPRQDFSFSVTAYGTMVTTTASTTASSTVAATVVLQASNDNVSWFGISSASATGTITTTATGTVLSLATATGAGAAVTGSRYAYGRAVVSVTGTGSAQGFVAF